MKQFPMSLVTLFLVTLLLGACIPAPAPQAPSPERQPTTAPVGEEPSATTAAPAETPAATAARVPLKDALGTLEPEDVWQNFYDLTQIPRPSHHEEQVRDFLVQFGQGLGLETIVDEAGNVLIRKPATKGMENRAGVILQAHMDMVPQKTPESTHDFLTDPIEAYVDGDWVAADGTSLGADDGSGIAIAMAVLQSQTLSLGPTEALFTVNEEDGLDGASGLQPGVLQGEILINLDSETEGEFTIGSAGGEYANIKATYAESAVPADVAAYNVTVSGLKGGHSGVDINLGRGHATKLLVRFLSEATGKYGVRVAQIASGTAANAIPRDASALVTVPSAQADDFLAAVEGFQGIVQAELAATEPDLVVTATPADLPAKVMDEQAQGTIIDALYGTPQGVMRMSDAVPDLVETSTNMGIVNIADGQMAVTCLSRSSVDSELEDVGQMIASVWNLAGVEVAFSGGNSGWNPNPNSPILLLMEDVYREMYGQDPKVSAVHAGLECGTIVSKYPGMDAISIGPTLQDVHTPDERMQVATVKKLADLLTETLVRVPEATRQPTPTAIPPTTLDSASEAQIQPIDTSTPPAPRPAPAASAPTPTHTSTQTWEVATLLIAPGEPGRLYALVKDSSGGIYASPTSGVRLMISDDFAATWTPFPGGLPVPPECMVNVNLDYFTPDALDASTCQGLYAWEGTEWVRRSEELTDVVAVVYGQPDQVWAAAHRPGAQSADVIRSDDGGRTWRDASTGLMTWGGHGEPRHRSPRRQHPLRHHSARLRRQLPAPRHVGG
jgi:dipeptidase D